jgi:hypothetical protein
MNRSWRSRAGLRRAFSRPLLLALAGMLVTGVVALEWAHADIVTTVFTDKSDYLPGQTVTIRGFDWEPGEEVVLTLHEEPTLDPDLTLYATADANGDIYNNQFVVDQNDLGVTFTLSAKGTVSGRTAQTTFTDANESATLDQCANGKAPSPSSDGCDTDAADWVSGNLGSSKSTYLEGDSIPYRMLFGNLGLSSHTVTIEWDTTKSSKHAIDYLTTVNQSVLDVNPCLGVSGCNPGSFGTFAIPADPQVTGAGVTPIAGVFRLYGGTITAVSAYSYADGAGFVGDKSARITITFTASVANPVLAWGGHIATRQDWGMANSAVSIPGSPYHTRLIDLDGAGGNQDRSLSADAVVFPGSITIIKDATPNGTSTTFPFTASPLPLTNFSIIDDGTQAFSNITNFTTYTVAESSVGGWTLTGIVCSVTSANGGSQTVTSPSVSIDLKEGENVTCTFSNQQQTGSLTVIKHVDNSACSSGCSVASDFTIHVKSGSTDVSGSPKPGSESGDTYTLPVGSYIVSENATPSGYAFKGFTGDCDLSGNVTVVAGGSKTCTLTNEAQTAHLKLVKTVTNDNGGQAVATDFTLSASGPTPISGAGGAESDVHNGTYALSETNVAGYSAGSWSCVGGTQNGSNVTLALGLSATCTINNNDQSAHLKLVKTVTNDNGGQAATTDFTLSAAGPTPISGAGGAESDVNAGTYALSETNVAGYTAGSWSCVGGTQNGSNVTLALGQSATCTINNNDQTAHLKLVKTVTNDDGGQKVAADFTLSAAGPTPISGAGSAEADVNAGTYALSETNVAGYTAGSWSCVGGTQNASNITLALGQSATCTINNNDQAGTLTVIKHVINDNGGTKVATDFSFQVNGGVPVAFIQNGVATEGLNSTSVPAGTYTVVEPAVYGYTTTYSNCTNIVIPNGGSGTCEITNDDQPGTIVIIKDAKPASGVFTFNTTGSGYSGFSLNGDPTGDLNKNTQQLNAGSYTAVESTQLGWILTGVGSPGSSNCVVTGSGGSTGTGDVNTRTATISLKNGDTVTCYFENTGEGVTRTQGFWATHTNLAYVAWFGGTTNSDPEHTFPGVAATPGIGDTLICSKDINTLGKEMGGFWSDISKKSNGAKRSALDQARMQLLQQLLAAELNASAFGSVPSGGSGVFASWENALCGTNTNAIKTAQQQAASFNTSGDSGLFTPGVSADSKYARSIADIPFWDFIN